MLLRNPSVWVFIQGVMQPHTRKAPSLRDYAEQARDTLTLLAPVGPRTEAALRRCIARAREFAFVVATLPGATCATRTVSSEEYGHSRSGRYGKVHFPTGFLGTLRREAVQAPAAEVQSLILELWATPGAAAREVGDELAEAHVSAA